MSSDKTIRAIQKCIANSIEESVTGDRPFAAVLGENPSLYSKSPALWNAAFADLAFPATYVPFDVAKARLGELLSILRDSDRLLGFNVTVPHKVEIMRYLDDLDAGAARIRAVNTVVRTPAGRLVGYNTDGAGFIDSILNPQPGAGQSFIASLEGMEVLLIGAGGSARAVAFHLADRLKRGRMVICNRTPGPAAELADEIRRAGKAAHAIAEEELSEWAGRAGLVINSTIKGQGGARELPDGQIADLEPYSALAPARPLAMPRAQYDTGDARSGSSRADVVRNNELSLTLARAIPTTTVFYDLIYFPEETVFLRHARLTGHKTMNGRAMIVCQAARGFLDHICRPELSARGLDAANAYQRVLTAMYRAW